MTLSLDKDVKVLTDKIASNKVASEEISSKVCSIFKDARAQLQLIENIVTPKQ